MLFQSPHANLEVQCSNQLVKRHPVTGDPIETIPAVYARFGKMGATYTYTNPLTHEEETGADITGHFFDTDIEAAEHEWDEDTKGLVERTLLKFCKSQPDRIKQLEREIPRAALPWPTYDETPVEKVADLASALGLVAEALAYEQENRARPLVLDGLFGTPVQVDEPPVPVVEVVPRVKDGPQEVGNPTLISI